MSALSFVGLVRRLHFLGRFVFWLIRGILFLFLASFLALPRLNGCDLVVIELAVIVGVKCLEFAVGILGIIPPHGLLLFAIDDAITILVVLGDDLCLLSVLLGGEDVGGCGKKQDY